MNTRYFSRVIIFIICLLGLTKVGFAQSLVISSNTTLTAAQFLTYTSYTIQPGYTLTVNGAVSMNTAGFNISVLDNGTLAFNSSITSNNTGNLSVTGTGGMTIASGVTLNSTGSFTIGVNTAITGSVTVSNSGSITNSSSLTISGSLTLNSSGGLTNTGTISVGGNVLLSNTGSITDNGTMNVTGNFTIQNSGGISGSGILNVTNTASTVNTGTFFGSSTSCTTCTFISPTFSSCAYKYKRLIRIDHTKVSGGNSLTNFPVYITTVGLGDQAQFKSVANGGHVQNANGYDIYFTASDGITPLNFQYENYVATTGEFESWVNIPSLSNTTDTYIYMYYGNSAVSSNLSSPTTWNSNYVGVWHMDEDPGNSAPQYLDATSGNPENGTVHNMTSANKVTGLISNACYFNGSNNYITFSVNSLPANSAPQTISTWVNYVATTGNNQNFVVMENGGSGSGQQMGFRGGTLLEWLWGGSTIVASPSVPTANAWHYCVYTYNGTTNSFYVDGVLKATSTTSPQTAAPTILALGCYMSNPTTPGGEYFNGDLDEIHILTTAQSAGWIATEYNNQSSPSTFAYISAEPTVWLGTTSVNWSDATNWSSSSVPASGANLIISNSSSNQPTVNSNVQVGSIWVQSGAALTIGAGNSLSANLDVTTCGTINSASTGILIMNSTAESNQNIAGTGTVTLGGLAINSTATSGAVTVSMPVTITNTLTLTAGIINTSTVGALIPNNSNLVLQNGVSIGIGSYTSTSYVNGPLTCQLASIATTTLNFPVGTAGDCRPVQLVVTHTTTNTYNYTTQLIAGSSFTAPFGAATYTNYPSTVDTLSGVHYWNINRTNASGTYQSNLDLSNTTLPLVTLYFGTDDGVYNSGLLTVCKTYTNNTNWVDIGKGTCSVPTGSNTTAQSGSITSSAAGPTAFNSFSYFTLGRLNGTGKNPLPIELLYFTAEPVNNTTELFWSTATETNNNYFTIERSKDGATFDLVKQVKSEAPNGNSTIALNYRTYDLSPYEGINYYRLKQTDYNGSFKSTNIVSVNFDKKSFVSIYPNPTSNSFFVNVSGDYDNASLKFMDALGREVLSQNISASNVNSISTSYLTSGIYYVIIDNGNGEVHKTKIVVQK